MNAPAAIEVRKKNNRACGSRFELECVHDAEANGVRARKHFLSGAANEKGDITLVDRHGDNWPGECKWKKALPKWLITALGEHRFCVFKQARGERFVLLRWDDFLGLLQ